MAGCWHDNLISAQLFNAGGLRVPDNGRACGPVLRQDGVPNATSPGCNQLVRNQRVKYQSVGAQLSSRATRSRKPGSVGCRRLIVCPKPGPCEATVITYVGAAVRPDDNDFRGIERVDRDGGDPIIKG